MRMVISLSNPGQRQKRKTLERSRTAAAVGPRGRPPAFAPTFEGIEPETLKA